MEKKIQTKAERKEQMKKGFFANAKLRLFVMCMSLASLMSLSAFAADGETPSNTATISSLISDAGTSLPSLMTLVWSLMTANPLITLFVIAAVVSVGTTVLRRLRRVAH